MLAPPIVPQDQNRPEPKYLQVKTTIERILECAVALNWKDLTNSGEATAIQVEYRTGTNSSLQYLKFWSSTTRGFWHFVCDYRMDSTSTHASGATFNVGHSSADLVCMLDAIMRHQDVFVLTSSEFLDGLVQVSLPSETELTAARKDMSEAMDRIGRLSANT